MRKALYSILYSFPVRLLMLHVKRNHFLLLSWIFLISISSGLAGSRYGISLLFLDPEYIGKVNFSSFCILGAAMGGFFVVWNVTSYILTIWHLLFKQCGVPLVIFYYLYFRNHCFSIERRIIKSDKYCSKSGRIYYGTNFCYTYFHGIFFQDQ